MTSMSPHTAAVQRWEAPTPDLAELIRTTPWLLGTVLTATYNGTTVRAVVVFDGLYVEGHGFHPRPTPALDAATGGHANGWNYWTLPDGRTTLADLREQYRNDQH